MRVRETMPDAVLNAADEVVLIDLTPEALLARLRAGKIYPKERIDSALNNFFKIENLAALREVALRQVAEEVESKRLVREDGRPARGPADRLGRTAGGRGEAAGPGQADAQRRSGSSGGRGARPSGSAADLDLLWVKRPGHKPTEEEQEQLEAIRRLASVLGADLLIEEGDDLVQTVKEVAEERGSTYVLIGTPSPRTGLDRFRPALPMRLIEALPGIDLRVVADRALRGEQGEQ